MGNLLEKIDAEKENVNIVLENLKQVMKKKKKSVIELSATATFMHNIYNGIENMLKQILKSKNIEIQKSDMWHKKILETSVKHKIISEDLADKLREYLAFRHFFIHGYGFMLEESSLTQLAKSIPKIWNQFILEIKKETP
ncbi:MAG: DUF86 domain-containing protein [Candidatus Aenigmarchaeota archaeon]|nr:DUF86 domain-containing protein [Candidatus Aenigmarchaeota archaeon]